MHHVEAIPSMSWTIFFCGFVAYLFWVGRSALSEPAAHRPESGKRGATDPCGERMDHLVIYEREPNRSDDIGKPICSDLRLSAEHSLLD